MKIYFQHYEILQKFTLDSKLCKFPFKFSNISVGISQTFRDFDENVAKIRMFCRNLIKFQQIGGIFIEIHFFNMFNSSQFNPASALAISLNPSRRSLASRNASARHSSKTLRMQSAFIALLELSAAQGDITPALCIVGFACFDGLADGRAPVVSSSFIFLLLAQRCRTQMRNFVRFSFL